MNHDTVFMHRVAIHGMVTRDHSFHVVNCSEQQLFPFWKQFKGKFLCSFSLVLFQLLGNSEQLPKFAGDRL